MPPGAHLSRTRWVGSHGGLVKIPRLSEIVGVSMPPAPGAHLSGTRWVGSHVTCHVTLLRTRYLWVRRWPPVKLLQVISSSPPPPPPPPPPSSSSAPVWLSFSAHSHQR